MIFKKMYKIILNILFPVNCLICHSSNSYLCSNCFKKIKILNLKHKNNKYLDNIFIASSYKDSVLKKLIIAFKYKNVESIGVKLGDFLSLYFNGKLTETYLNNKMEYSILINSYLTHIPSRSYDNLKRDFCPSEILLKQVSLNCNLKYLSILKIRNKRKRQAGLNKKERIKNIKNSFKIKNIKTIDKIKSKNIIIVDDVITTGSTINEAAKTLKEAGVKKVYALILAKNN